MTSLVDILVLVALGLYVGRGFLRGALLSFLDVAGTVCAYVCVFLFFRPVGEAIHGKFGWPRLICCGLAAMLVFFGVALFFAVTMTVLLRRRQRREHLSGVANLTLFSRIMGAFICLAAGAVVASFFLWTYSLLRTGPWGEHLPDIGHSVSAQMSRQCVRQIAWLVLSAADEDTGRKARMVDMLGDPEQAAAGLRALMGNTNVTAMMTSPDFRETLFSGDERRLRSADEFLRVTADPSAMNGLRDLGLVSGRQDPDADARTLARMLAGAGGRLGNMIRDEQVSAYVRQLQAEGLLRPEKRHLLIRDRRFLRILDHVLAPPAVPPAGGR